MEHGARSDGAFTWTSSRFEGDRRPARGRLGRPSVQRVRSSRRCPQARGCEQAPWAQLAAFQRRRQGLDGAPRAYCPSDTRGRRPRWLASGKDFAHWRVVNVDPIVGLRQADRLAHRLADSDCRSETSTTTNFTAPPPELVFVPTRARMPPNVARRRFYVRGGLSPAPSGR